MLALTFFPNKDHLEGTDPDAGSTEPKGSGLQGLGFRVLPATNVT